MTPEAEWRWFGCPGHLVVALDCRFHLCTQVGGFLVSTVGEYLPDAPVREILCECRGIALDGRGDARLADYLQKVGFEELGVGRTYETMVFRTTGDVCHHPGCSCGLPTIALDCLDMDGYTTAGAATIGHLKLCQKYAREEPAAPIAVDPHGDANTGTPTTRDP